MILTERLTKIRKLPMFAAFQYRNYRYYWIGMVAAVAGSQINLFATLWLVYQLTSSPLYLGLAGGATAAGNLGFSLFAGVTADRVDKRRFIMYTQFGHGILNFLLGTLALTHLITVWQVLIISFLNGVVSAFDSPTRHSLIPHLIGDRKELMSAIAMSSLVWQSGRMFGPVLAALLLRIGGIVLCFYFNAGAYLLMIAAIYMIRVPAKVQEVTAGLWRSLLQGVNFVRKSSVLSTLVAATLLNSLFGMSYVYLMPVFARDVLQVGPDGFGLMMASIGVGSFTGVTCGSALGGFKYKGRLFLGASIMFGIFLIFFSQSKIFPLTLLTIVLSAMVNYFYMVTVQTLLQTLTPDELRGRVMSIYALVFSLQPLGSLISGAIAQYYGTPFSVAVGGAVVSAFSIFILLASPATRNLRV